VYPSTYSHASFFKIFLPKELHRATSYKNSHRRPTKEPCVHCLFQKSPSRNALRILPRPPTREVLPRSAKRAIGDQQKSYVRKPRFQKSPSKRDV